MENGDEDEHLDKKKKVEIDTHVVSIENPNLINNNNDSNNDEDMCVLCMETVGDEKLLVDHQCPQCVHGAWKICHSCNESLLSRTCPVCRSDYAPLILYKVPGMQNLIT